MAVREDYRAKSWTRMERLAERWSEPILHGRKAANHAEWKRQENWILGLYWAPADSRLWVPAKGRGSLPHESRRVLNYGHPAGKPAVKMLLLVHAAGLVFAGFLASALLQGR